MTTTTINVGKARVFTFAVLAAGVPDTTTAASASTSNPAVLRATVNPSNKREFAVVALGAGLTNANVTCGPVTAHALINVNVPSPPPPDTVTIDEAGVGPEVDPSTIPWA